MSKKGYFLTDLKIEKEIPISSASIGDTYLSVCGHACLKREFQIELNINTKLQTSISVIMVRASLVIVMLVSSTSADVSPPKATYTKTSFVPPA